MGPERQKMFTTDGKASSRKSEGDTGPSSQPNRPDIAREIISMLTHKVRAVTVSQAARGWWEDTRVGRDAAERFLKLLQARGTLVSFTLRAHPELTLTEPVWCWRPGEPAPKFGAISYELRKRWTEPLRPTTIYVASEKSARIYAGFGGRLPRLLQATHDLHVSTVYLRLYRNDRQGAAQWISEDMLLAVRRGQKIPDAELVDSDGQTVRVVEFGGGYPPERVRDFHEYCDRRQVPYELW